MEITQKPAHSSCSRRLSRLAGAQHQPKAKAGASHSSHGLLSLLIPTALLALQQRSCQFCMHPELCASQHWAPDGQVLDRGDDGEVFKSLL